MSSDEESAHLISSAERFQRSQISKQTGRHKVFAFHQISGLCSLSAHENYRSSVHRRKREEIVFIIHKSFVMRQRRIIKFSMKRMKSCLQQHRHAVVAQDLYSYRIQSFPTKTKTPQETMKYLQKFGQAETRYYSYREFFGIHQCF